MADEETSPEDKTEDASPRRLDEARREGRTALSKDGVAAGTVWAGLIFLGLAVPKVVLALSATVRVIAASIVAGGVASDSPSWMPLIGDTLMGLLPLIVVITAIAAVGVLTAVAQTGGGFWPNLLEPDPSRLWNTEVLTKAFSRQGIVDTAVAIVRALAVAGASGMTLWAHRHTLVGALQAPVEAVLAEVATLLSEVAWRGGAALALLGLIDVFLTRRRFFDKLKMTREELKREMKEEEGDPHIRSARKRRHRELRRGSINREVPRADAVVVNPTHIAVVIRYRKKDDRAPRVTAKGKGPKAEAIRALAVEHGIPIVRDVPLARLLHARVKIGREVPAETYRAVAAVLTYVARVTGRKPGAPRPIDDDD
jgi:flagellar biosynthesis protein FlhB